MNCTECGSEIKRGERYVAIDRHIEREGRLRSVKVEEADLLATYHPSCEPPVHVGVSRAHPVEVPVDGFDWNLL